MDRTSQNWLPPLPPRDGYPATEPPAPASPGPSRERSRLKRLFGPLFIAGLVILKFGAKLKALLLLLPKLKVLTTAGSMLLSVAAYALIWGWRFGVGFVALLFVHEMGHFVQMRREGIKPNWMVFIPFLGAAVGARSLGGNALAEARIGLAGPILGTLGTAALVPVAIALDSDLLRALAFVGFFLNLFNLIPLVPFDGGRAMAAMAPWMWFVGFGAMLAFFVLFPNPILILFLLLGGMETWRRWKQRKRGEEGNAAYYRVRPAHRLLVAAVYVGLIAFCAVGMDLTFIDRSDEL
ncbi:MAG: site-2 protease family protein [Solirubrobacteraceae bacterium]